MPAQPRTLILHLARVLVLYGALAGARALAAESSPTIHWTGASNSFWSVPQNWSPVRVPDASDHVEISGGAHHPVRLDVNATVASLRLGTNSGANTQSLIVDGRNLVLNGESIITARGALVLSNGNFITASTRLRVAGLLGWSGGTISGAVEVEPGGVIDFAGPADKRLWDHTTITNRGMVRALQGRITARAYNGPASFVNVTNSAFEIAMDGQVFERENGYHAFAVINDPGALMRKAAGTNTVLSDIVLTHDGELRADSGRVEIDCTTVAGAGRISGSGAVHVVGRSFTVNGPMQIHSATFAHDGGDFIGGSNAVLQTSNNGRFEWNGGTLFGQVTLAANSQAHFGGGNKRLHDDAQFDNEGTVTWTDGDLSARCYTGPATIRNGPGALFLAAGGTALLRENGYYLAYFVVDAGAELRKTDGGTITANWHLQNDGVAVIQQGNWRWNLGGSSAGEFSTLSAGVFSFSGGTHTLNDGARLNGSGTFRAEAGAVTANGVVNFAGVGSPALFELVGGSVNGSNFVVGGSFVWSNGWVGGVFTVAESGRLTAAGPEPKWFEDHARFENHGIVNWTGLGDFRARCYNGPAQILNFSNAVFQLSGDGVPFRQENGYYEYRFQNLPGAQIRKTSAGTNEIRDLRPTLEGDVRVDAGTLQFNSATIFLDGLRFKGAGVVQQIGSDVTLVGVTTVDTARYEKIGGDFWMDANGGTIRTMSGGLFDWRGGLIGGRLTLAVDSQMRLSGPASKVLWDHSGLDNFGTITWVEGDLEARCYNGPASIRNLSSGRFAVATNLNLGRQNGYHEANFTNEGTFALSTPVAQASANGWWYTQSSSGTIESTIAGTEPGVTFGRASFNRPAIVSGFVRAQLADGFSPEAGQQFTYFSAASLSGSFAAGTFAPLEPSLLWALDQSATSASLRIEANSDCASRPDGLITWLRAEDSALDTMGQHSGGLIGNPAFVPGKVGRAFRFDGADDSVDLGAWFNRQTFSFAMWLKEGESQQTWADIFDNNHTASRSFVMQWNNTGHQYAFGGGAPAVFFDLTPGIWQHVVVTREPGFILRVYVDGVVVDAVTNAAAIPYDGTEFLRLSRWGAGGRNWNGQLDEFQIYDRGLTAAEVQALYSSGAAGLCTDGLPTPVCAPQPSGLIGWWTGDNTTNDLALSGPATLLNGAGFGPGYSAQAFALDGNDDLISIGDLPGLQGTTELTLMAWVLKNPGPDHIGGIIGKWDTGENPAENSFLLFNGEDDYLNRAGFALQFSDNSAGLLKGSNVLPAGNWIHIAATWRSSDGRTSLYKNGVLEAAGTNGAGKTLRYHTAFPARLGEWGRNNRANSHWSGSIDEAMVLNRALSSNEVAAIVAAGPEGVCRLTLPDLAVKSVSAPANAAMGQPISITFTLTNQGAVSATGVWANAVLLAPNANGTGAEVIGSLAYTGAIPVNASLTFTQSVILPAGVFGTRYLGITADSSDAIAEMVETNNTMFAAMSIGIASPNLLIETTNAPATARFGESIAVRWWVRNGGGAEAKAAWFDEVFLSASSNSVSGATLLATVPAAPLAAGSVYARTQSVTLPFISGLPAGTYYLLVVADANNAQTESTEVDNLAAIPITITYPPLPDLALTRITAPAFALAGLNTELSWIVTNRGNLSVTGAWSEVVGLSQGGGPVQPLAEFRATNLLHPGAWIGRTQSVVLPPALLAGDWQFTVSVDSRLEIVEQSDANNTAFATAATTVPAELKLLVPATELIENATPLEVTVTRNGDRSLPLVVNITNSHPGELEIPQSVTVQAGQASASFPVAPVHDGVVDGAAFVTFGVNAPGYRGTASALTVHDIDVPNLTLTLETTNVVEGLTLGVTVTRDYGTNRALNVILTTDDPSQLTIPNAVVIASNQFSTSFAILAVDDTIIESLRSFQLAAQAPGFTGATGIISVTDNDLPAVALAIDADSVSEGAGPQATTATITRSPVTARPLTVQLVSDNPGSIQVPATATIGGNQTSISIPVAAIDNQSVDGTRNVTLRVYVQDAFGNVIAEGTPDTIEVRDDDGPTLKLNIARDLVPEGEFAATTATVSRNTATAGPLTVSLASSDVTELTVASSVIIPAGETSVTFDVTTPTDGITDGNQYAKITASAAGFTPGIDAVVVSDIDLPDFVITSVSAPTNGFTEANFPISYRLENHGIAGSSGAFTTRVLLSHDALLGDDTLLGEFPSDAMLGVGQFIEQTAQFRAPTAAGRFWIMVVADANAEITEGLENNNTAIAALPIDINPSYTAYVATTVETALAGTPVPLNGTASRVGGGAAADIPVSIHMMLRGTRRVLSVQTDANGTFSTVFTPLPGEAGIYEIGATHPGVLTPQAQDSFALLGLRIEAPSSGLRVLEGTSVTGSLHVVNLGEMPLSGLSAQVLSAPANLDVSFDLANSSLEGLSSNQLAFTLTANNAAIPVSEVRVQVTTAEGASAEAVLHVLVESERPRLVARPDSLYASMLRGQQTIVELELVNEGGAVTGPLTVSTPNISWLSVGSTNPLASLAPNATNRVTLILTPDDQLPLGPYTGGVVISDGARANLAVPFEFRAIAEAKGDLVVSVVDEFTYYASGGPKVTNAAVMVRDAFTKEILGQDVTDESGAASFPQLMEGHYEVEVTADKHSPFIGTTYVAGGRTNEFETFLSRQTVSYRWTVVPTTIEDRTEIRIETTFETFVPAPVVTIEPALIDLAGFTGTETQINLTIQNHGLVAAQDFKLNFPGHPSFTFTPLVEDLGNLAAGARFEVPVLIQRVSPQLAAARLKDNGGGACSISAGGCWQLPCGPRRNTYCASVSIVNLGCPPPIYIPGTGGGGGGTPYFPVPPPNGGPGWSYSIPNEGTGVPPFTPPRTFEPPQICDCDKDNFEEKCLEIPLESSALNAALEALSGALKAIPNLEVEAKSEAKVSMCTCCDDNGMGFKVSGGGTVTFEGKATFPLAGTKLSKSFQQHGYDIEVEATLGCPYEQGVTVVAGINGKTDCHLQNPEVCGNLSVDLPASIPCAIGVEVTVKQNGEEKFQQAFEVNATLSWGLSGAIEYCRDGNGTRTSGEICGKGLKFEAGLDFEALGQQFNPKWEATLVEENCFQFGGASPAAQAVREKAEQEFQKGLERTKALSTARTLARKSAAGEPLVQAAEDEGGVCAKVVLQIGQDVVLARNAFNATLDLGNNSPASSLENISVTVFVVDENGQTVTERFGIRPPTVAGMSGVDGTGLLGPDANGTASWILVPTSEAAPRVPTRYGVGGVLSYRQDGNEITVPLFPAPITVYPDPRLHVKYFHQRDVFADDPFTREVIEPSVPFNLAVMVENRGYGTARDVRIISGQPQIIENEKGLLIDFRIIGTEVAGQAHSPSLTVNFGEIPPATNGIARWLLTSTLQGLFLDYSATFEHVDSFGKTNLSLIDEVTIHEMTHLVQAQGAFEDGRPDFLVNDIADPEDLPDRVHLSDGSTARVEVVTSALTDRVPDEDNLLVQLTAEVPGGWVYLRIPDPANGALSLARVVRSDGREIYLNTNVWTTDRTFIGRGQRPIAENILHLLDHESTGAWTLYYAPPPPMDESAPVSVVNALPSSSYPQIPVTWEGADADGSGIASFDVFVSDNGGPFTPWLQQTLANGSVYFGEPGHTYAFYSVAVDNAGNREAAPVAPDAQTIVDRVNAAPAVNFTASTVTINEGETLSLAPNASDADAGQSLTFSLGAGAPAGVLVNGLNGQLTWPTSEGNGPSTNVLKVIARDNGAPSLTATAAVTVVVQEVNTAPALQPLAPRTVNELQLLTVPVTVTDADLPAQSFTFSLGAGAPTGASINSAGVFTWTPNQNQGPATNRLSVIARDNGTPSLSATQSFTVVVRDSRPDFVVGLGGTNLIGGQSAAIPLHLESGLDLTNVTFRLELSAAGLTNLSLSPAAQSVGSATLSPLGARAYSVRLTSVPGDVLQGFGEFARLAFGTHSNGPSALVLLSPMEVTGIRSTGEAIFNGGSSQGRVVVVNEEPLIAFAERQPPTLEVFAPTGVNYTLEFGPTVNGPWTPAGTFFNPSSLRSLLTVTNADAVIFYRVRTP